MSLILLWNLECMHLHGIPRRGAGRVTGDLSRDRDMGAALCHIDRSLGMWDSARITKWSHVMTKLVQARQFVTKVEADLGHAIDSHILDLFFDNAEALAFTDDECFELGNAIRAEKGLSRVAKWW